MIRIGLNNSFGSWGMVIWCIAMLGCRGEVADRVVFVPTPETPSGVQAIEDGSDSTGEVWFEDVTSQSGVEFTHDRGPERFWLPEITGGGGGWIDYDSDGDPDLYLVQGGDLQLAGSGTNARNRLFENLGQGKFQDVTEQAGVGDTGYGMGLAVGDYDGDGHLDLYVTNVGPNVLYRNLGDGRFEDVTKAAGVDGQSSWTSSAAFVDYDRDGDLDLFMANYLSWSPQTELECFNGEKERDYCAPVGYQMPTTDSLFRNDGNGVFIDVSKEVGLHAAAGNGLGVALGDFDQDGRVDIYVANDGNPNQLWLQKETGRFTDRALIAGCAVNRLGAAEAGMGVAAVDIDNDNDLDLFMTHLVDETNTLYLNQGGYFEDATVLRGLASASMKFTGFGMGFVDFDHDGQLDLYVANGRVTHAHSPVSEDDRFAEPNQVFRGNDGRFVEVAAQGATRSPLIETSRGAAFADFNGDGTVDVAVINSGGSVRLLANRIGNNQTSLRFRVLDRFGSDALGARLRLSTSLGIQTRIVQRAYSFLASNEAVVHFGVPVNVQIEKLEVVWPDGATLTISELDAGAVAVITHPEVR